MRILVYATAAEYGGSLTIIQNYYNNYKFHDDKVIFIISNNALASTDDVKIISYPKIKKSKIYRLYFYWFILPKITNRFNPDKIISFNNIFLFSVKKRFQSIYLHQIIPFIDYKNRFKSSKKTWYLNYLLGPLIRYSVKKTDEIIVQSDWFKDILINSFKISSRKISVEKPTFNKGFFLPYMQPNEYNDEKVTFFYPAGLVDYKRHDLIMDTFKNLNEKDLKKIDIFFTFNKNEARIFLKKYTNHNSPRIVTRILSKYELGFLYQNAFLIYTSQFESYGLPLQESRELGGKIITLNKPYSREILKGYKNVYFFNNSEELESLINDIVKKD